MNKKQMVQETEIQSTAVLTELLKKIRIDTMKCGLKHELNNKVQADKLLKECRESVNQIIDSNRGGTKGMHGFIGERAQCYICNIKSVIKGEKPLYVLIDDNGMTDYLRGNTKIQQKACISNGHLGLDHILAHIKKYPVFKEQDGIYQIPKDLFAKYKFLSELSEESAGKLRKEDYRLWKYILGFNEESPNTIIEPMVVDYGEIQAGRIFDTLDKVEDESYRVYCERRNRVIERAKPSLQEGIKITAFSAAIESGAACAFTVIDKAKKGKKPTNYDANDWKDIGKNTAIGAAKGGTRGATIYVLTNYISTPAPVAAAVASVVIDTTTETIKLVKGEETKEKYAKMMLSNIGGATSSAVGAMVAKNIMKTNPIAGIVGGLFGNICWQIINHYIIEPALEDAA